MTFSAASGAGEWSAATGRYIPSEQPDQHRMVPQDRHRMVPPESRHDGHPDQRREARPARPLSARRARPLSAPRDHPRAPADGFRLSGVERPKAGGSQTNSAENPSALARGPRGRDALTDTLELFVYLLELGLLPLFEFA